MCWTLLFMTLTLMCSERTANLLVFIISFITTTVLTNSLIRPREKRGKQWRRVTGITYLCEIILVTSALTNKAISISLPSSHLFLEHITDDIADLLKA